MIREELRNTFCFNKEELLEYLNTNYDNDVKKIIQIIEELDLPDLSEMLEYNENSNEALVYDFWIEQEGLFSFIVVSLERVYDIIFDHEGLLSSHCTAYSIPIAIVPYGNELVNLKKEDIKWADNRDEHEGFGGSYNHFYGF